MPEDDRTFITLHDGFPEHPKIVGLSDKAFRWVITEWCYSSRNRTNGMIPQAEWRRAPAKVRRELTEPVPGWRPLFVDHGPAGVEAHDYLKHQRSAEQITQASDQKKRAGAKGNHDRWHVGPNGRPQPDCPLCPDTPPDGPPPDRPPARNGSQVGSHSRSRNGSHPRSQTGSQNGRTAIADPEESLRDSQTDPDLEEHGGTARERAHARPRPSHLADQATAAWLPRGISRRTRAELGVLCDEAAGNGASWTAIGHALLAWSKRSDARTGLLPNLVDDAVRAEHGATAGRPAVARSSTADAAVAAVEALRHTGTDTPPHGLRAISGGQL